MTDRDAILRALAKELDPLPSDADAVEAAPVPPKRGRGRPRKNPMANSGEAGGRREVREILTDLVKTCDLWHARDGGKFATFTAVDGTTHHVRVRAAAFADWLIARAYEATGGAPGAINPKHAETRGGPPPAMQRSTAKPRKAIPNPGRSLLKSAPGAPLTCYASNVLGREMRGRSGAIPLR